MTRLHPNGRDRIAAIRSCAHSRFHVECEPCNTSVWSDAAYSCLAIGRALYAAARMPLPMRKEG